MDLVPANLALALAYEQTKEWDAAIERYRRVTAKAPNQAAALNNLAYILATQKDDAANALPLAKRAYAVSVQDPTIGDTLAWIQHLLGQDTDAEQTIVLSARRLPNNAEVLMHAAFILAGTGKLADATKRLDDAVKIDPTLESRQDIKELRTRLRPAK